MKPESRLRSLQLGLLLFTLLAFMLSLMLGPVKTSLAEVIRAILSRPHELSDIILGLRLPRALLAYLVGACLSLSGAILQGYFRNPLADPFILGASSGASLGAVLSLQLGLAVNLAGLSAQSLLAL